MAPAWVSSGEGGHQAVERELQPRPVHRVDTDHVAQHPERQLAAVAGDQVELAGGVDRLEQLDGGAFDQSGVAGGAAWRAPERSGDEPRASPQSVEAPRTRVRAMPYRRPGVPDVQAGQATPASINIVATGSRATRVDATYSHRGSPPPDSLTGKAFGRRGVIVAPNDRTECRHRRGCGRPPMPQACLRVAGRAGQVRRDRGR